MSTSFDSLSDVLCRGLEFNTRNVSEGRFRSTRLIADEPDAPTGPNWIGNTLASMIEGEILPRLLLAHRSQLAESDFDPKIVRGEFELNPELFARKALTASTRDLVAMLGKYIADGGDWEKVCLEILAPAARYLGELWEDDRCTFTDVTVGVSKLHEVLHEVVGRWSPRGGVLLTPNRAYFAPVPGEQHVFGLMVLQEFFEASGWDARCDLNANNDEILRTVREKKLDLVGFSVSQEDSLESLEMLIRHARAVSQNNNLIVMVGGRVFLDDANVASRIGANATAEDACQAVEVADSMVSQGSCK